MANEADGFCRSMSHERHVKKNVGVTWHNGHDVKKDGACNVEF